MGNIKTIANYMWVCHNKRNQKTRVWHTFWTYTHILAKLFLSLAKRKQANLPARDICEPCPLCIEYKWEE